MKRCAWIHAYPNHGDIKHNYENYTYSTPFSFQTVTPHAADVGRYVYKYERTCVWCWRASCARPTVAAHTKPTHARTFLGPNAFRSKFHAVACVCVCVRALDFSHMISANPNVWRMLSTDRTPPDCTTLNSLHNYYDYETNTRAHVSFCLVSRTLFLTANTLWLVEMCRSKGAGDTFIVGRTSNAEACLWS